MTEIRRCKAPLSKLREIKHIVTHASCPDGMASAMILQDALPDAKITFCQHNTPLHKELQPESNMLFCDFSPDPARVQDFIDAGVIVLDHHKQQQALVERFGDNGAFADEVLEPGVSGATLAYQEVWLPLLIQPVYVGPRDRLPIIVERFAKLAGIRDTWQKDSPLWEAACAQAEALFFWPPEDLLATPVEGWEAKLTLGPILYEKRLKGAAKKADGSLRFDVEGVRVAILEGTSVVSDAAEYLGDTVDLLVAFSYRFDEGSPKVIFSLRSHTDFNCGAYASSNGGGGHTKAAGFSVVLDDVYSAPNPIAMLQQNLAKYLLLIG